MAVMAKFAASPRSIPTILNRKPDAAEIFLLRENVQGGFACSDARCCRQ